MGMSALLMYSSEPKPPGTVRAGRPIFRDSLSQWRNYDPCLAPLKAALGDALIRYRD